MKILDLKNNNIDCFGNIAPFGTTFIWPIEKGGSDIELNKIMISTLSIDAKGLKTKGHINYVRYSIRKQLDQNGNVYGVLLIQKDNEWFEIKNSTK